MPLFSKECLDNLRQKIDLVEVLSSHVEFKHAGSAYKGLCPFHDEKTPSFMIHKGDKHYHCFGCGAHGDAIQFLMTYLKMSFSDAVESLAQRFHVHLDFIEGTDDYKGPSKSRIKDALETAARFYHFYLLNTPEGGEAVAYLRERGIDQSFIEAFQIGLAPKAPGVFQTVMHEKKFTHDLLLGAGLIAESNRGGYRDFFYERITFPIHNPSGSVIGFSARKYKEETFGGKYVNTPETALFKKSRILFGMNYCRRQIAKDRKAIVVEGQIDALRLIHSGLNYTVAGQGTAFGEGHAKELIALGVNQVFLAMDPDDAGQDAASKIGHFFLKEGVHVTVVQLPKGSDPDAFIREKGKEAFLKLMEEGIDFVTYLVEYQSRFIDTNTPAGKNELVQLISKQIRLWDQPLIVMESLRKLAFLAGVPEELIGFQRPTNILIRKSASIGQQTVDPDRILESDFLLWIIKDKRLRPIAERNITPSSLYHPLCCHIYQMILQNPEADILSLMNEQEEQILITELLEKKVKMDQTLFYETMQKILDRNWMRKREEISRKLQGNDDLDLLQEFNKLKRVLVERAHA